MASGKKGSREVGLDLLRRFPLTHKQRSRRSCTQMKSQHGKSLKRSGEGGGYRNHIFLFTAHWHWCQPLSPKALLTSLSVSTCLAPLWETCVWDIINTPTRLWRFLLLSFSDQLLWTSADFLLRQWTVQFTSESSLRQSFPGDKMTSPRSAWIQIYQQINQWY